MSIRGLTPTHITRDPILMPAYIKLHTIDDVDTRWYTLKIYRSSIRNWLYDQPDGWRLTPNSNSITECFDLREDLYTWFILRWG